MRRHTTLSIVLSLLALVLAGPARGQPLPPSPAAPNALPPGSQPPSAPLPSAAPQPFIAPGLSPQLVPLEQGVEDRGELNVSQRVLQADLGAPTGFQRVYRVPGSNNLLMRINGGMYAVFPESVYAEGRRGLVPEVPAGTIFHIGAPSAGPAGQPGTRLLGRDPGRPLNAAQIDHRVRARWSDPPMADLRRADAYETIAQIGQAGTSDSPGLDPAMMAGRSPSTALRTPRITSPMVRTGPPTVATDEAFRVRRLSQLLDQAASAAASRPRADQ